MRDRQQRKLAAQTDELRRTENMEQIRQEAELLKANLYRVHRGDRTLVCENYFEPDSPENVLELDPLKSPQQNLENRYKRYRKAKGAKEHLGRNWTARNRNATLQRSAENWKASAC